LFNKVPLGSGTEDEAAGHGQSQVPSLMSCPA
jgi:hypothetical protein